MTTATEQPTLASVLQQARQLSPADQARLASHLLSALEPLLEQAAPPHNQKVDPRTLLDQIREDFRKQGPVSPSMTEDLEASRR